jgi:hypothetical protein
MASIRTIFYPNLLTEDPDDFYANSKPGQIATCSIAADSKPDQIATCSVAADSKPDRFATCSVAADSKPGQIVTCSIAADSKPDRFVTCSIAADSKPEQTASYRRHSSGLYRRSIMSIKEIKKNHSSDSYLNRNCQFLILN